MRITDDIAIDEREVEVRFIRASGPGGQNVNKVSTAVELRFDVRRSQSLPAAVRDRLVELAGRRINDEGVLVIRADTHRTQERNRAEARARLAALVHRALVVPRQRIATRPTRASRVRRTDAKVRRGEVKRLRRSRPSEE